MISVLIKQFIYNYILFKNIQYGVHVCILIISANKKLSSVWQELLMCCFIFFSLGDKDRGSVAVDVGCCCIEADKLRQII